jgi:iron complex transport system substrate-binding protein
VTVQRKPQRIISLGPAVTETLYAIGAGSRLVAVTEVDSYPPECKRLPKVGGFAPETISSEKILELKPDLVLAAGRFQEPIVTHIAHFGIPVVAIDPTTLDEVQESILLVGRVTGQNEEAQTLVDDFHRRLDAVAQRGQTIPEKARPRVLYILWDNPLMSAGPNTFIGQMIELAGGHNLMADSSQHYPHISDEVIIGRDPELLLVPDHGSASIPERVVNRPGWNRMTAVRNKKIGVLPEDLVNRPGPRLIEGLEAIEKQFQTLTKASGTVGAGSP